MILLAARNLTTVPLLHSFRPSAAHVSRAAHASPTCCPHVAHVLPACRVPTVCRSHAARAAHEPAADSPDTGQMLPILGRLDQFRFTGPNVSDIRSALTRTRTHFVRELAMFAPIWPSRARVGWRNFVPFRPNTAPTLAHRYSGANLDRCRRHKRVDPQRSVISLSAPKSTDVDRSWPSVSQADLRRARRLVAAAARSVCIHSGRGRLGALGGFLLQVDLGGRYAQVWSEVARLMDLLREEVPQLDGGCRLGAAEAGRGPQRPAGGGAGGGWRRPAEVGGGRRRSGARVAWRLTHWRCGSSSASGASPPSFASPAALWCFPPDRAWLGRAASPIAPAYHGARARSAPSAIAQFAADSIHAPRDGSEPASRHAAARFVHAGGPRLLAAPWASSESADQI